MSRIKKTLLIGFGVLAMVLVGTGAQAVLTARAGTVTDHQQYVHETNAWQTSAAAFVDVPGASVAVTVPTGTRKMIDARFTAESQCGGGGWCSVRIVVVRSNGTVLELDPQSGTDFAFDSGAGADNWESHAIERTSPYLPAGSYRVKVQAGTTAGANLIRLDDWTLAVERVRP
jgi:hypothetical protein